MSALNWSALGFLLFVLVAGPVGTAVVGLGTWRRLRAAAASSGASLGDLAEGLETLAVRLSSFERSSAELRAANDRLSRSLRRTHVLLAAVREVSAALDGVRAYVPRA